MTLLHLTQGFLHLFQSQCVGFPISKAVHVLLCVGEAAPGDILHRWLVQQRRALLSAEQEEWSGLQVVLEVGLDKADSNDENDNLGEQTGDGAREEDVA